MIVEDEYFIASEIAHAVEQTGNSVVGPISTCNAALDLLSSGTPINAAVLDLNLHDEMSYTVAAALRLKKVPFVFATGYGVDSVDDAYQDVPRWEKPFDYAALARSLQKIAEEAA